MRRPPALLLLPLVTLPLARRAARRSNTQLHRTRPTRVPAAPPAHLADTAATLTADVTADPATAGGNA